MTFIRSCRSFPLSVIMAVALFGAGGCQTVESTGNHSAVSPPRHSTQPCNNIPRELSKVVLPTYRIEPPDILLIDAVHVVPRAPYRLKTMDQLSVQVDGAFDDAPISGIYAIGPGGLIQLGARYGSVKVSGKTIEEAKVATEKHLAISLAAPLVSISLASMSASQQISGEHLVGPDGNVTLGTYGSVSVVGMTIAEAKFTIEAHLSRFLDDPEVSVDVFAYNSKMYYIITQGAGMGDGVYSFPVTGRETVLDAISQINGLEQVSSKKIWIARPTRQTGKVQILPVSWESITAQASTDTNYQIMPGDRVFIAEDKMIAFDTSVGKIIAPFERMMGFAILGAGTVTRYSGNVLGGGGNPSGSRGF